MHSGGSDQTTVNCIWDTDYNSDNWDPDFITIFVAWQLRVTLDSIRNSCDVYKIKEEKFLLKQRLGHLGQSSCAHLIALIWVVDTSANNDYDSQYNDDYDGIRYRSSSHRIQI